MRRIRSRTRKGTTAGRSRPGLRALLAGVAIVTAAPVLAQDTATGTSSSETNRSDGPTTDLSFRASLGMTAGPDTFAMTFEAPYAINEMVSIGPLFQLGFSDDHVLFAPTVQAYVTPTLTEQFADWHPYAHIGMGLVYLEDNDRRPGRDEEDTDFLLVIGTGVEYALSDTFYMGTGFLFDVIPGGAVGNRFVFGWQILTFRQEF